MREIADFYRLRSAEPEEPAPPQQQQTGVFHSGPAIVLSRWA
jgi:hypothetical protein